VFPVKYDVAGGFVKRGINFVRNPGMYEGIYEK